MRNIFNQQKGVVIVLVILIVAGALAAAATFGNLIVREIQMSRLIDQSIQAYYLAESGSERALYQSRRREAVKADDCGAIVTLSTCQEDSGYCSLTSGGVACITKSAGDLVDYMKNGWSVAVSNEEKTVANLNVGESVQVDLFSPYQTASMQNFGAFMIESDINNANSLYGELTNLTWLLSTANPSCPPAPYVHSIAKDIITLNNSLPAGYATPYLTALGDQSVNSSCSYILRLSNNIINAVAAKYSLGLYWYDSGNAANPWQPLAIPSRLIIESTADYGNSRQIVRVRAPMRPPLSGLYDFVLFSEEQIVK